jgi:tetratricopeptide (TPR) repeat protein
MYLIKKSIVCLFLTASINLQAQKEKNIQSLLQKLEKSRDTARVNILFDIGNYYLGIQKFDSNKIYLNEALAEANKSNFEYGRSRALTGLGYMYRADGNYEKALEFFFEAIRLKENMKRPLEVAALHDAIGRIYISLERPSQALENYLLAQKVYESYKDSARLLPLITEIGGYYATIHDHKKAIVYYEKVLSVYNRWEENKIAILPPAFFANYKIGVLTNYAYSLIESNRPKEALIVLHPLLEKQRKRMSQAIIDPLVFDALANARLGNYKEALKSCEEGLTVIKGITEIKFLDESRDFHEIASDAYQGLGDFKKANSEYRLFKEISDSISNNHTNTLIVEMQTKYEAEKKDQQIVQLNQKRKTQGIITGLALGTAIIALGLFAFAYRARNLQKKLFSQKEEILIKERQMEKNVLEKKMAELEQMAIRAQMNPHFIFNCLNSVQHFVMRQDIEGVNRYLSRFAHLIRQTLDNSSRPMISLADEIKYLDTYLALEKMKSNSSFNYEIHAEEAIDKYITYIPCMLLQPFVENSIRHGIASKKDNAGFIKVSIYRDGMLCCVIEDNGIGRSLAGAAQTERVYNYESKGLSLTFNRINIINKLYNTDITASIQDITDSNGKVKGTKVIVKLPPEME